MTQGTVKYIYPNGAKAPTQAQMVTEFSSVHALVTMAEDSGPVDVIHNMQFDPAAPAEVLQIPIVNVTAVHGGPSVQHPVVAIKDDNTITISKASGPGTNATYDVWISRHPQAQAWEAEAPAKKK
jgi:hypothetical protein